MTEVPNVKHHRQADDRWTCLEVLEWVAFYHPATLGVRPARLNPFSSDSAQCRHVPIADSADAANSSPQLTRNTRCTAARKAAIGCARSDFIGPYDRVADISDLRAKLRIFYMRLAVGHRARLRFLLCDVNSRHSCLGSEYSAGIKVGL